MHTREELLALLNGGDGLENLKQLMTEPLAPVARDVNNHIHTTYSFSPYSPTAAVYFSRAAGLCTCGLVDHDSIAGAEEFLAAAKIAGIGGTIGLECRVSFEGTPFADKLINNPDQKGVGYILFHAVPHSKAKQLNDAFQPLREHRNARNRKMIEGVNSLMGEYGITLDFEKDVLPLSNFDKGGTVTERHLSSALAYKMIEKTGSGKALVDFIKNTLKRPLSAKIEGFLLDEENPHRMYDLLGWIKSDLISRFYVPATDELMHAKDAVKLANEIGAIPVYSYLGDVGDSVTGDKRAQKFEDDYLDELIQWVADAGYKAIAYFPTRNTPEQLKRLKALIAKHGLMPISGEDINSPRQQFVCMAQRAPEFADLYESAWALIEHELRMDEDPETGLFGKKSVEEYPDVIERMYAFSKAAQAR